MRKRLYDGRGWNTSGIANGFGSNFFLVTLGNDQGPNNWVDYFQTLFGQSSNTAAVAGTFMHELGHTLGLKHGGSDHINHKPNYLSIMNYVWQFPKESYAMGWQLDYARMQFNTLNENALNESTGIGGRPGVLVPIRTLIGDQLVAENGFVDFNANNQSDAGPIIANINGDRDSANNAVLSTLSTQEDWSKLIYRGYGLGWEQDAAYTTGDTYQPCMNYETFAALGQGAINGTILLQGYTTSTVGKALVIEVWQNGVKIESLSTLVGESGIFAVSPANVGDLILKFHLLTGLVKAVNVNLGSTPIVNLSVSITNGDCDRDNEVGIGDYALLSAIYGLSVGDPGYDTNADLNGDTTVDIADYAILSASYGEVGD